MTDRPIIFSGPMVRALLAGTKTQTRRVLKPQPCKGETVIERDAGFVVGMFRDSENAWRDCRVLYQPGDRLYVRETWQKVPRTAYWHDSSIPHQESDDWWAVYREGWERTAPRPWRPSIHMPRWASRLTLVVTDVKVERVQDIGEKDAKAEGMREPYLGDGDPPFEEQPTIVSRTMQFRNLWNRLNEKRGYGWDANPWVAAVAFTVHHGNVDSLERTP